MLKCCQRSSLFRRTFSLVSRTPLSEFRELHVRGPVSAISGAISKGDDGWRPMIGPRVFFRPPIASVSRATPKRSRFTRVSNG